MRGRGILSQHGKMSESTRSVEREFSVQASEGLSE